MDATELRDHLWRHGVSADDRDALAAAHAAPDDQDALLEIELFARWLAADGGEPPAAVDIGALDPAAAVLSRALQLREASRRRDVGAMDACMAAIDHELAGLDPAETRTATARACVDLALAEAALRGGDATAARRCLTRVAGSGPPAFRIAARQRQAILLLAQGDLPTALTRARQAVRLAEQLGRPTQGRQAELVLGLVAYSMGDAEGARSALAPVADTDATARALLASFGEPAQVVPLANHGLDAAAQRRDALGYAICCLVGGRACAAGGRLIDALVTVNAARAHLHDVAPELAIAIDGEVAAWRRAWGEDAFRAAEQQALSAFSR
jgi:tetratricopeptide (TPR) repeat protein